MAPPRTHLGDEVPSVVDGLNAMQITQVFVDNSTQTTTESMTIGVQAASKGVDTSTQTELDVCCKCKCSTVKSEPLLSETVGEMVSKINGHQSAKKTSNVALVIPPPPPLPMSPAHLDKSLPPNFILSTLDSPTVPAPPPLPAAVSTPISNSKNTFCDSADFQTPAPPPPPPPMMGHSTFPSMKPASSTGLLIKKFKTLPETSIKMKTLNWTKVPKQKIAKSFWSDSDVHLPVLKVDFNKMEELFGQTPVKKSLNIKSQSAVKLPQSTSLSLLDSQRSFLVNIFLKQFKENVDFVFDSIKNGVGLPVENLKALMKLMPEKKEIAEIRAHASCKNLGEAENFFLHLSDIADYELRVQAMLYREEFDERFSDASSHLEKVLETCEFLINDCSLKQFLTLILQLGNQLNAGTYAGNAVAFKLASLSMLADTRANKPKMTFLHYVVDVASSNDTSLLEFRTKVADFQKLAKTPIAAIEEEVHSLSEGINEIIKKKSSKISSQFGDFFQSAKKRVDGLLKKIKTIREMKSQLAVHFCEEPATFQLNECYQLFADFFEKVNTVLEENDQMKKIEEKAEKVRAEKQGSINKQFTAKRKIFEDEVDQLINDVQKGIY